MNHRRRTPGSIGGGERPPLAVYPGSFDPPTRGHLDIIERAARIFPRLVVAVVHNPNKRALLTLEQRLQLLRRLLTNFPGVEVDSFKGLLIDYLQKRSATIIVRGIRAFSDFEYELQMALMNRKLAPQVETVFLMPCEAYSYVSSQLVKEVKSLGGQVRSLVPPEVDELLTAIYGVSVADEGLAGAAGARLERAPPKSGGR